MAKDLTKLLGKITKKLGGVVTITQLSDVRTPYHERIGFGIMDLDIELHGGLPRGTINEVIGPEGVGKNLLANMHIAEARRIYEDACNVAVLSFGYKLDTGFMRKCGVKVRKTDDELRADGVDPALATDAERGEQVGNVMFLQVSDADLADEKPAEAVFSGAVELVASGEFHVVVIDEMASGETGQDVKKDMMEEVRMATWAACVTQFTKKCYSAYRKSDEQGNPNGTIVLVLQPVRAEMDVFKAKFNPTSTPSGHALKHAKANSIDLKPGGWVMSGSRQKLGKKVKWKITKGKLGISEGAEGEYDFIFFDNTGKGGIDPYPILANCAKTYGTLTRRGAFYYVLDYDTQLEGGIEGVIAYLRTDPEVALELRTATLKAALTGEVP